MCVGIVPCQIYTIDWGREQINVLPGGLIRAGFRTVAVATTPRSRAVTDALSRLWIKGVLQAQFSPVGLGDSEALSCKTLVLDC